MFHSKIKPVSVFVAVFILIFCASVTSEQRLTKTPDLKSAADDCCIGMRGNVNFDQNDVIDIADLVYFIEFAFGGLIGIELPCEEEADVDGDGQLSIADIVYFVSYMFHNGPPPLDCGEINLNLDSRVIIGMQETIIDDIPQLLFFYTSERILGCINYLIGTSFNQNGNTFSITFEGFYLTGACFTATGPAHGSQLIGRLAPGAYDVIFNNGIPVTFQLVVTENSYELIGADDRQFIISNSQTPRTP